MFADIQKKLGEIEKKQDILAELVLIPAMENLENFDKRLMSLADRLETAVVPAVNLLTEIAQVKRARILAKLSPAFAQRPTDPSDYSNWRTVTQVAKLLVKDMSCDNLRTARSRVSIAVSRGFIRSNDLKGSKRLLDPMSVDAWRLAQRDKLSDAADEDS
ncbi:MAG: hypothetical protein FWD61_08105 [Phycisphaerales bacterium]|nr:hypothetical protein [Phycisphaerales bacterium]